MEGGPAKVQGLFTHVKLSNVNRHRHDLKKLQPITQEYF